MKALTRRQWGRLVAAPLIAAPVRMIAEAGSTMAGVRIGAQTYVFRDRPLERVPPAFKAIGLTWAELWSGHVESALRTGVPREAPPEERRDRIRKWRLSVPMSEMERIRTEFAEAGVTLTSYDIAYRDDWTDEEIARSFEMARALGVQVITSSAVLSVVPRVARAAEEAKMHVSFHNHSSIRPNEFATPDDFAAAMKASSRVGVTLDIGHFTAANFDALGFLDAHHARIHALHIKDRQRDQGPGVPFGTGDAPIAAVLQRLRDRRWQIPAHIEFDYRPPDPVAEVAACLEYCRKALA